MMYDFEKFDSRKEYGEYIESKDIGTLIKWCKENKSSKDKGAYLAANALIEYLIKGEFPYSKCRAQKKRGQFKKITNLDYYVWSYARIHGVSQASREFKKNAQKIDKNINSKFEPKTIRDRIHKIADKHNTDYKTMMESNSFPYADLKNKRPFDKPHGLLLSVLIIYYKYLELATGYRRPKDQKAYEEAKLEEAKLEEEQKKEEESRRSEAEASGVEYKEPFEVNRFFKWCVKAREFDKRGK